jgi:alkanesulfonate monooxygenase SsuD/methylene tetrahydromethanopterin reductase-like flavin-dependent oxidoreductase (luciferase family)
MAPSGEAKPMLGMVRHVVVAESDREALELAGPAYNRWSGALTYLHRDRGAPVPPMLEVPFLDALDSGVCIAGSASTVRDSVLRQIDVAGANYMMFLLAFGDLSLSASLRTIAGIAAEIVPAIREMKAQYASGWMDG